jgi:hypothetical protein
MNELPEKLKLTLEPNAETEIYFFNKKLKQIDLKALQHKITYHLITMLGKNKSAMIKHEIIEISGFESIKFKNDFKEKVSFESISIFN